MGNNSVQKISNPQKNQIRKTFSSIDSKNLSFQLKGTSLSDKPLRKSNSLPKNSSLKIESLLSKQNQQNLSTDVEQKIDSYYQATAQKNENLKIIRENNEQLNLQNKQFNDLQNKKDQKIFIFDWDDTLFFSNHLRNSKSLTVKNSQRQILRRFDDSVSNLLKSCIKYGQIIIVTNSKEGWVKYCSQLFIPKTFQVIFKKQNIKVISTRPKDHQKIDLRSLGKWKYTAFKALLQQFISNSQQKILNQNNFHLICIGDSQQQISAGNQIFEQFHSHFKNLFIKTIKLQDLPEIDDLIQQQELFLSKLQTIVNTNKKLVIRLERPHK